MTLITRWDEFRSVRYLDTIDARCCCCKGIFTGARFHLRKVLQRNNTGILCNSCKGANTLRRRHTDPPSLPEVSALLRSILTKQWGLCAITGEPLQWGFNVSPDHIVSVGGSKTGKKSPWDPGNLQIVSIAANNFKNDLSMGHSLHLLSALRGECDLQNPRIRFGKQGTQSACLAASARTNSKHRSSKGRDGMVVEIDTQWTREQWRSNPVCYWSGLPFPEDDIRGMTYTVSLDRINDHVGYTRENTVLCLSPFNRVRVNGSSHKVGAGMNPTQTRDYILALKTGRWHQVQSHYPVYHYTPAPI